MIGTGQPGRWWDRGGPPLMLRWRMCTAGGEGGGEGQSWLQYVRSNLQLQLFRTNSPTDCRKAAWLEYLYHIQQQNNNINNNNITTTNTNQIDNNEANKTDQIIFYCRRLCFTSSKDAPSKFEANLTLRLRVIFYFHYHRWCSSDYVHCVCDNCTLT